MRKINIASLFLLFFLHTSLHSAVYEKIPTNSFFSRIAHMYHTITRTALGNSFSTLKNIKWTKTTIAKAGIIVAVAAAATYGISRLAKYFFRQKSRAVSLLPLSAPIVQLVASPSKILVNTTPIVVPSTGPVNTVPAVTPAVVQPQPTTVQQAAAITQGFTPVTEESFAVVPYFNDIAHHVTEPIIVENPIDHARVIVQQLRVFNQFEEDQDKKQVGGGSNSCGYHAGPKNVVALAGLIQGKNTSALLTDGAVARSLFNIDPLNRGILRRMVIRNRQKAALYTFYQPRIQTILPAPPFPTEISTVITEIPTVIRAIYNQLIRVYLNNCITEIFKGGMGVVEITRQTIIEAFSRMPITVNQVTLDQLACTQQALVNFMHNIGNIGRYLNFPDSFRISQEDLSRSMETGEMLESEEIKKLIFEFLTKNVEVASILNPERVAVHAFESSTPEELDLFDEMPALKEQIRHQQLPQKRVHLFVLGDTDQVKRNTGHWVTMALEIARNSRRYTITDSANNDIRIFGGACHNIIRYLEGDRVANALQPSPAFKQRLLTQLQGAMQQCRTNPRDVAARARLELAHTEFDDFVHDANRYDAFGGQERFSQQMDTLINFK